MTAKAFAKEHGLRIDSVYRWGREFANASKGRSGDMFTEVRVRQPEASREAGLELLLKSGRALRVRGEVDLRQLRALIEVLESC